MTKCSGRKKDGSPCSLPARGSSGFCWGHDPTHSAERQQVASKGGRGKALARDPRGEIARATARIWEIVEAVEDGDIATGKASVAFQGLGVLRGYLDLERKIKESEELEQRLIEVEEALKIHKGGSVTRVH
jgi:hypothetical protein